MNSLFFISYDTFLLKRLLITDEWQLHVDRDVHLHIHEISSLTRHEITLNKLIYMNFLHNKNSTLMKFAYDGTIFINYLHIITLQRQKYRWLPKQYVIASL